MPRAESWRRTSGAYEHPLVIRAYKWHVRSEKISRALLPSRLRDAYQRKARRDLARLLQSAIYIKSPVLVSLYHYLARIDHDYRVILSYRQFGPYAASRHVKNGWPIDRLVAEYLDVNQTGLLEMHRHGGCAVSYEELTNPGSEAWAETLAELTGLDVARLLAARRERVSDVRPERSIEIADPRPDELYRRLQALSGKVLSADSGCRGEPRT
jgi:hypothetical protein